MTIGLLARMAAALLALSCLSAGAHADETKKPRGVVELFTSQGCSSCPPADELLGELAARHDVIALAYHVDYWDYLGWQDTLGSPENTARQYEYGKSFGIRSVYTPQAVVNGQAHVNGASRAKILGLLAGKGGLPVEVRVTRSGDSVIIDAAGTAGEIGEAHLVLVYYDAPQRIVIERGENDGRSVTYWNAVSDIQTAGMWHGKAARYELPLSQIAKKGGCAVLLQSAGKDGLPGPILGAALIRVP